MVKSKFSLFVLLKTTFKRGFNENEINTNTPNTVKVSQSRIDLIHNVSITHIKNLILTCEKSNLPLLIIWIPPQEHLYPSNFKSNHFPFNTFKRALFELIGKESGDISFYDPTDKMRRYLSEKEINDLDEIYFYEGHFNKKGNKVFSSCCKDEIVNYIFN